MNRRISPLTVVNVMLLGLLSCQGITQNVETLRAQKLEIVDESGTVQMEVASRVRDLEQRVQKLEAAESARIQEQRNAAERAAAAGSAAAAAVSAAATVVDGPAGASSSLKTIPPRPSAVPSSRLPR